MDNISRNIKCKKCERHIIPIKLVETDKKKKKWLITQCPACDYKSDIEEYNDSYFNPFI